MTKEDVKLKVISIIVERLRVSPEEVTDNGNFRNELGMDSLDQVDFVMGCEKEFSIPITDKEYMECWNLQATVDIIYNKLNSK